MGADRHKGDLLGGIGDADGYDGFACADIGDGVVVIAAADKVGQPTGVLPGNGLHPVTAPFPFSELLQRWETLRGSLETHRAGRLPLEFANAQGEIVAEDSDEEDAPPSKATRPARCRWVDGSQS